MADVRRCLRCCAYSLYKVIFSAKALLICVFLFINMSDRYAGVRQFLMVNGETINAFGLMTNMMTDVYFILIAGIGLMLILSDAPFFDEAQQYVLIRAKKLPWIAGQILCVLVTTGLFMLAAMAMQHMLLGEHLTYDRYWGRAIHTLARTNAALEYGISLHFYHKLIDTWSVRRCFALAMVLRWGAYGACALIMLCINLWTKCKAGLFAPIAILLLDMFLDFGVSAQYYILSISSLAQLSIMNMGTNPYFPRVELSMTVLWGCFLASIVAAMLIGRRADLVYSSAED